jgi:hypothetical protein
MSKTKGRIELNMSILDVLMTMCDGNPEAITALNDLYSNGTKHDPDAWCGGLTQILMLDTYEIYGSRIWMFYSDVCKKHLGVMVALIRAVQMGGLGGCDEVSLNKAINNYGNGLDLKLICDEVQKALPNFVLEVDQRLENENRV